MPSASATGLWTGHDAAWAASINGVALHLPQEQLDDRELRQRACTELLRQAAQSAGLLSADDPAGTDGIISASASDAIEALLDQALALPEPSCEDCQRYFAANPQRFQQHERVHARHILFAVTPGVDITLLRKQAEATLIALRAQADPDVFASQASALSNCPSSLQGGDLGWLTQEDCAPEFAREIFNRSETGVLPRLVASRFGFHVLEVLAREPGKIPEYHEVAGQIRTLLTRQHFVTAMRHYIQQLAAQARVQGVALDTASSPLMQ